jgi:hypothetical protein
MENRHLPLASQPGASQSGKAHSRRLLRDDGCLLLAWRGLPAAHSLTATTCWSEKYLLTVKDAVQQMACVMNVLLEDERVTQLGKQPRREVS